MSGYVLNFGKYNGRCIGEIPDDYLAWMYTAFEDDGIMLEVVENEIADRGFSGVDELLEEIEADRKYGYMGRYSE